MRTADCSEAYHGEGAQRDRKSRLEWLRKFCRREATSFPLANHSLALSKTKVMPEGITISWVFFSVCSYNTQAHGKYALRKRNGWKQDYPCGTGLASFLGSQGRIKPPKAARGHATSNSANIDSVVLNITRSSCCV